MRLWRISNYTDLSGMGGVRFPARWHSKGRPILYTAEHPAGALTEFLAHLDLEDIPVSFQLLTLEIDDTVEPKVVMPLDLARGWTSNVTLTRSIGDRWLAAGDGLLLRVPSVLVPDAFNLLVNPRHADIGRLRLLKADRVPLDGRLVQS